MPHICPLEGYITRTFQGAVPQYDVCTVWYLLINKLRHFPLCMHQMIMEPRPVGTVGKGQPNKERSMFLFASLLVSLNTFYLACGEFIKDEEPRSHFSQFWIQWGRNRTSVWFPLLSEALLERFAFTFCPSENISTRQEVRNFELIGAFIVNMESGLLVAWLCHQRNATG